MDFIIVSCGLSHYVFKPNESIITICQSKKDYPNELYSYGAVNSTAYTVARHGEGNLADCSISHEDKITFAMNNYATRACLDASEKSAIFA